MYIYVRFNGDYFSVKESNSIIRLIEISIKDIKSRKSTPCSIIDERGNTVYNKKELLRAIEDHCIQNQIDLEFYSHLWIK